MLAHEIKKGTMVIRVGTVSNRKGSAGICSTRSRSSKGLREIEAEILRRYDINEETYRQRFRAASRKPEESYRELVIRMQNLQKKWMRDCTSLEEVFHMLVMEQLINMMPSDLRVWIRERRPKSTLEAGKLADHPLSC